jgi:hypothetical protein
MTQIYTNYNLKTGILATITLSLLILFILCGVVIAVMVLSEPVRDLDLERRQTTSLACLAADPFSSEVMICKKKLAFFSLTFSGVPSRSIWKSGWKC